MKMKKMRKILAVIMILAMIMPMPGNATEINGENIIDFKDDSIVSALGFTKDSDFTFDGESSAKWDTTTLKSSNKLTSEAQQIPSNWKDYTTFNAIVYSGSANNSKFNVIAYTPRSELSAKIAYIKLDFCGWKKISIPLDKFISARNASWDDGISSLMLDVSGYTSDQYAAESTITSPIYFDSMWLSNEGENSDEYVVADFGLENYISSYSSLLVKDEENSNMYNASAKWNSPSTNTQLMITTPSTVNFTEYTYLNQWVYSESANNQVVNIVLYTAGYNSYKLYQVTMDFEGWNLIKVPVSSITAGAGDLTRIVRVDYNTNGWGVEAKADTEISFEKIWLSNDDEENNVIVSSLPIQNGATDINPKNIILTYEMSGNVMEMTTPANIEVKYTNANTTGRTNDYSVCGYKNKIYVHINNLIPETEYTVKMSGVVGENGNVSSETYNVAFSTSEEIAEKTYIADFSNAEDITKFGFTADENVCLSQKSAKWNIPKKIASNEITNDQGLPSDWTGYETLNMLIYSPKASNAKISFVPLTSSSYMLAFMKLDFVGWKKVSVPIRDFYNANNTNIKDIKKFRLDAVNWANIAGYEEYGTIDAPVYIDSIWLEKPLSDEYVIAQYDNYATIQFTTGGKLVPDTANTNLYAFSGRWNDTVTNKQISTNELPQVDLSGYNYVNILAYSHKKTDAKINTVLYGGDFIYNGTYRSYMYNQDFTVDWENSWKVISIPVGSFISGWAGTFKKVRYLSLSSDGWNASPVAGTDLNIEKIWCSKNSVSSNISLTKLPNENEATDLSVNNRVFTFKMSDKVYEDGVPSDVQVFEDGQQINDGYSVFGDKRNVCVAFTDNLKYGANYEIKINNAKNEIKEISTFDEQTVSFSTESEKERVISDISLEIIDSKVNASTNICNYVNGDVNATLYIAQYDQNGTLVKVYRKNYIVKSGNCLDISVSRDIVGEKAKAVLWDDNIKPYTDSQEIDIQ